MNHNGDAVLLELDSMSANLLAHLAEIWGVSEGEAVRRALEQANSVAGVSNNEEFLKAFRELQRSLGLTSDQAAEWQDALRKARR